MCAIPPGQSSSDGADRNIRAPSAGRVAVVPADRRHYARMGGRSSRGRWPVGVGVVGTGSDDIRIFLLGRFAIELGGVAVPDRGWRLRKARDLVKVLALAPNHRIHREELVELLWPD